MPNLFDWHQLTNHPCIANSSQICESLPPAGHLRIRTKTSSQGFSVEWQKPHSSCAINAAGPIPAQALNTCAPSMQCIMLPPSRSCQAQHQAYTNKSSQGFSNYDNHEQPIALIACSSSKVRLICHSPKTNLTHIHPSHLSQIDKKGKNGKKHKPQDRATSAYQSMLCQTSESFSPAGDSMPNAQWPWGISHEHIPRSESDSYIVFCSNLIPHCSITRY